jgi:aquaporin related protein
MSFNNLLPLHRRDTCQTSESSQKLRTSSQSNSSPPPSSIHTVIWLNEAIAAAAEFVGTFMFLFFAFGGTQVSHTATTDAPAAGQPPDTNVLLYIALSFGFSLMVNVWIFFRVSGGLFNPAVSLSHSVYATVRDLVEFFVVRLNKTAKDIVN